MAVNNCHELDQNESQNNFNYFRSASEDLLSSPLLNEGTSISELPGYVGPSASNVEVDAAENARGE